ncbi:MAG: hypothetical protein RPR97_00215 [Colwellia sp.]
MMILSIQYMCVLAVLLLALSHLAIIAEQYFASPLNLFHVGSAGEYFAI